MSRCRDVETQLRHHFQYRYFVVNFNKFAWALAKDKLGLFCTPCPSPKSVFEQKLNNAQSLLRTTFSLFHVHVHVHIHVKVIRLFDPYNVTNQEKVITVVIGKVLPKYGIVIYVHYQVHDQPIDQSIPNPKQLQSMHNAI